MDFEAAEVKASGGVVWRRGAHGEGVELVVVHRPRYDDWSLPKGKLDPGETWEQAALREVDEEVGLRCRLGEELPAVSYTDHKGRAKAVRYWLMEPEDDARGLHAERRGGRDALGGPRDRGRAAELSARRRAGARPRRSAVNRDRFPGLAGGWARLDGPAGTQMVDTAIDAMADFMRSGDNANHGGVFAAAHATDACVERARAAVARLLGAEPRGVAFGPSMTAMTMRLSAAVGRTLEPGDEVVVTRLDHDANVRPWVIAAERAGATVRWAEPDRETLALPASAVEAVLSDRTRWVAVTAASNASGTVPELDGIVAAAHAAGARISIDAVAASPHRALSLRELGADTLACSAYKWYGPHIGILCAAPALLEELGPDKLHPSPDEAPDRFELGTLPFESLAGVAAAADYLLEVGFDAVRAHEEALMATRWRACARSTGVTLYGDPPDRVADADVQRRRPDLRRGRPPRSPSARSRSGTATTTPTSSSASSAWTRTAPSAPASCTTTTPTTPGGWSRAWPRSPPGRTGARAAATEETPA